MYGSCICLWRYEVPHKSHPHTCINVRFQLRWLGSARVEVLLRQMALKPKASADGTLLKGPAAKQILFYNEGWVTFLFSHRWTNEHSGVDGFINWSLLIRCIIPMSLGINTIRQRTNAHSGFALSTARVKPGRKRPSQWASLSRIRMRTTLIRLYGGS